MFSKWSDDKTKGTLGKEDRKRVSGGLFPYLLLGFHHHYTTEPPKPKGTWKQRRTLQEEAKRWRRATIIGCIIISSTEPSMASDPCFVCTGTSSTIAGCAPWMICTWSMKSLPLQQLFCSLYSHSWEWIGAGGKIPFPFHLSRDPDLQILLSSKAPF